MSLTDPCALTQPTFAETKEHVSTQGISKLGGTNALIAEQWFSHHLHTALPIGTQQKGLLSLRQQ